MSANIPPGPNQETWQEITTWLGLFEDKPTFRALLERNYVLSGYPDLWLHEDWEEALKRFRIDLNYFGIQERAE